LIIHDSEDSRIDFRRVLAMELKSDFIDLGENVTSVLSWSPKGTLAVGLSTGAIRLYESSELIATLEKHSKPISSMAWDPKGSILATGARDNKILLWKDGEEKAVLSGHKGPIYQVAWSPDSELLASCSGDRSVRIWSEDESLSAMTGHTGAATSLSWSPSGELLASGSADSTIRLWNRDGTGEAVLKGHEKALARVEWHPDIDSGMLASSAYDHKVRLWREGKEYALLEGHKDRVFGLTWSHDGTTLASGGGFKDAEIRLWSHDGDSVGVLKGHTSSIYQLGWRFQGDILASSSFDSTVRLWRENEEIAVLEGLKGPALDIEWSPDGQFIASAATGSIGIWNLQQE